MWHVVEVLNKSQAGLEPAELKVSLTSRAGPDFTRAGGLAWLGSACRFVCIPLGINCIFLYICSTVSNWLWAKWPNCTILQVIIR